jgi:hypothetical protein
MVESGAYIFWLNSNSLCRSLWLVEVKHGLYGFRGRIKPSGPIWGAGGGGGGTPKTGAIMSFPGKNTRTVIVMIFKIQIFIRTLQINIYD